MELNDYSQRFARVLFAAFPQWRRFELTNKTEIEAHFSGDVAGCLIVKIPSPVAVASPPCGNWLLIDTCDGEITITYDYFHGHSDSFSDVVEDEGFRDAVEFLQAFTREEIGVAIFMKGEKCCASSRIKPNEKLEIADFTPLFDKIIIRTWKGSHDQKQRFVR